MPEIITLDGFNITVQPDDSGGVKLLLTDTMMPRQYVLSLDADAAKTIGQAMVAPRVAQPPAAGKLHLPR